MADVPETAYPPMEADAPRVDVVVVGGGITGLTAAALLRDAGRRVAVVEAGRVATGTTGNTTAKITALHRAVYHDLIASFGLDRARAYAEANAAALGRIARFVDERGIDCDFRREPAFTFTEEPTLTGLLTDEAKAAQRCGLPAVFVRDPGVLPFPVAGAVVLDDQASFHPRKYAVALASSIGGDGSRIYETTRAIGIVESDAGVSVETDRGILEASAAIVATLTPFVNEGMFWARTHPERSYAMACRIRGEVPRGMFISLEEPTRSIRTYRRDGETMLIVGGENHKSGQERDTERRYATLEAWARERFDVASIEARWSAQDFHSVDGVPYVGRLTPKHERVFVATGFKKWGMTNGTAAAMILSDLVEGRENPWAATFDATRINPRASAKEFVVSNVSGVAHLVGERLMPHRSLAELTPGEGEVVNVAGERLAVYKEPSGALHAVGARCTHLGCSVHWNTAERTWDCPCHGSCFDTDGRVLQGPATKDLEKVDLSERVGR